MFLLIIHNTFSIQYVTGSIMSNFLCNIQYMCMCAYVYMYLTVKTLIINKIFVFYFRYSTAHILSLDGSMWWSCKKEQDLIGLILPFSNKFFFPLMFYIYRCYVRDKYKKQPNITWNQVWKYGYFDFSIDPRT